MGGSSRYFLQSLLVHILPFLILWPVGGLLKFLKTKQVETMPTYLKSSIRVDVLELPRHTLKELRALDFVEKKSPVEEKIKAEKKVEVKQEKAIVKEEVASSQSLDDLLREASKRKIKNDSEGDKEHKKKENSKLESKGEKQLDKILLAGNKLSAGVAVGQGELAENQTAFTLYAEKIVVTVRQFWELPSFLKQKNLNCRAQLFIAPNGELARVQIVKSSQDDEFDARAIKAVKQASPFPAPPPEISDKLSKGQIILGFPI